MQGHEAGAAGTWQGAEVKDSLGEGDEERETDFSLEGQNTVIGGHSRPPRCRQEQKNGYKTPGSYFRERANRMYFWMFPL